MGGGNGRLQMILGKCAASRRVGEVEHAAGEAALVPARAVLFLEPEQAARVIDARGCACGMQVHQRQQSVGFGLVTGRVHRQQFGQPDGFLTYFIAHQLVAGGCLVPFVEHKIKRTQNAVQAALQIRSGRDLERNARFGNALPGAGEPLGNGGVRGQERPGNFGDPKSAKGLERQRSLRRRCDGRVAANKHQPEAIIRNFGFAQPSPVGDGRFFLRQADQFGFLVAKNPLAPYHIQGEVSRRAQDPGGGICGQTVEGPGLQRPDERLLHHVFSQRQMLHAKDAGQGGDHSGGFRAKKVLHHLDNFPRWRLGLDRCVFPCWQTPQPCAGLGASQAPARRRIREKAVDNKRT